MARLTAGLWSCNSVAPSARAAERRRLRELLHEHPAIRLDDALRRDVIRIRGEFDVAQAGLVHFVEELLQGLRRIAPALLPGNDGVPDMAEAVRRERLGARLPAESYAAAELAVPHPAPVSRQPGNGGAIRKRDWGASSLLVDQAREKGVRILRDARQLLARRHGTGDVIR